MTDEAVHYEEGNPAVEVYNEFRTRVGWGPRDTQTCQQALADSLFSVRATLDGETIGFGRIIGDGLYFYVQDLIVDPDHQGRGVGRRLMDLLIAYLDREAPPGAFVGLMAARGTERFYEKWGFRRRPDDGPGMAREHP